MPPRLGSGRPRARRAGQAVTGCVRRVQFAEGLRLLSRKPKPLPTPLVRPFAPPICERYTGGTLAPRGTAVKARSEPYGLLPASRGREETLSLGGTPRRRFPNPGVHPDRLEHLERPPPAAHVVAVEVELDGRYLGLDGAPQGPSDVGHQREQVHPGQLPSIVPAEVGGAQGGSQPLVELRFLGGVAEVEAGVVVAAQLVVDDAQRNA